MDNAQPAQSILETLRTVEFRLGLKGYNVDEVDEYLEKAAVEAEAVQEQSRQITERLRQATERIAQLEAEVREGGGGGAQPPEGAGVSDDSLQRTLLLAQKFVDQAKRESEAEAAELVAKAEARARATMAQAEEQARQLSTDADRRLKEEVTRLEAMRGQLVADVENMARHLEGERNRLRSSLTDVLKWIEGNIQPVNSLMAVDQRAGDVGARPAGGEHGGAPRPQSPNGAGAGEGPRAADVGDRRGAEVTGGAVPGDQS